MMPGVKPDLPFGFHVIKNVGDFGSEAMAVNIPMGTSVAQESFLLVDRKRLPDLLRDGTQAVDYAAPVDTFFRGSVNLISNQTEQAARGSWRIFNSRKVAEGWVCW